MVGHMLTSDLNPFPGTFQVLKSGHLPERPNILTVFEHQWNEVGCLLLDAFELMVHSQQQMEGQYWCQVDSSGLSLLRIHHSRAIHDSIDADP